MKALGNILPGILDFRKELHRHPELAGKELETCRLIRERLAQIPGVRILPPFLKTDTVAFIDGNAPGKNVTLRADIDALPVTEETGVSFASQNNGCMHACGHDVHAAILMGAAEILSAYREEFSGSIRLVFQPGEERLAMAKELIAAGAIADPAPDFVAALHVCPDYPVGVVASRVGTVMAANRHFCVTFTGQGGHGSMPHLARNPIPAAAAAVVEAQSILNQRISARETAVLSIATFHAGAAENVIPETASFSGTIRAESDELCDEILQALKDVCQGCAAIYRVQVKVDMPCGYAATIVPPAGAALAEKAAKEAGLSYRTLPASRMGSEDFAYYLHHAPGVYVRLGVKEEGKPVYPAHNPHFLPGEAAIAPGIRFLVSLALAALK